MVVDDFFSNIQLSKFDDFYIDDFFRLTVKGLQSGDAKKSKNFPIGGT